MPANSFWGTAQQCTDLNPWDFYLWGHVRNLCVFNSNWKWRDISPTHFDACQSFCTYHQNIYKCVTVHEQMCSYVRWFRWTSWSFVADCDLSNSENSTVIKLGLCTVNTVRLQMNGAVSKVNKKFISHLTRAKRTPSAVAAIHFHRNVQVLLNVFFNSAESDVLQKETATFSLGHPVCRI